MIGLGHHDRASLGKNPTPRLLICILWVQGGSSRMQTTCSEQVSLDILLGLVFMTKELAGICTTFSKVIFRIILRKTSNPGVRTSEGRRSKVGGEQAITQLLGNQGKGRKTPHRFHSNNAHDLGSHFIPVEKLPGANCLLFFFKSVSS